MARSLRPLEIFPITTRFLQVLRTEEVTPGMYRVTLGGEQLRAHTAENGYPVQEFRSDGFDDEFKVLIKHPDVETAVGPTQADGVLDWPRGDDHMLMRTYTARRWDAEAGELDVDFVVHGVGPATSWARKAQVGETIQIAGPKSSATHPQGADWVLIAGDETALPAIGRWLEEWPDGARAQVFVEVAEQSHRQLDLPIPEGVELTWLVRDGAEAGTTTLLFDALTSADWWEGKVFAWVAGEANTLKPIRRWLRNDKALPKEQVDVTGYWRRQEVAVSEENPELQDFEATEDTRLAFHELSEIFPGFALRVAATIGLGTALGESVRSFDEILSATSSNAAGLHKLLRYLEAIEILEQVDGGWRLTAMGRELDDDRVSEGLSFDGAHGHRELAGLLGLLSAVRTGAAAGYEETSELRADRMDSESGMGGYLSAALAPQSVFADHRTLVVHGRGAATFATAIVDKHPDLTATVVASAAELEVYRQIEAPHERVNYSTEFPDADLILLTEALRSLPDDRAAELLRTAASHGRVLLFAGVLNPELAHDHDYEHDLEDFSLTGGGERDRDEYSALFAEAGLPEPERSTIGWGMTLHDFSTAQASA